MIAVWPADSLSGPHSLTAHLEARAEELAVRSHRTNGGSRRAAHAARRIGETIRSVSIPSIAGERVVARMRMVIANLFTSVDGFATDLAGGMS
jgi:hypothetical protein